MWRLRLVHPRLLEWWMDNPSDPGRPTLDNPDVRRLVDAYEAAARTRLTAEERRALAPYTAAVPLYAAALAGFSNDPAGQLRDRLPFLRLSEWLLAHPEALWGSLIHRTRYWHGSRGRSLPG